MSIIENKNRIGNFTSSNIYRLMASGKGVHGFGATALTYIDETNLERKLGRSIRTESYTRDMAWGKFLEYKVFGMLEFDYELTSQDTDVHPEIPYWAGSKDLIIPGKKIGEIKCYQPKNFAQFTDALLTKDLTVIKAVCCEEYWQAVSNAIINKVPCAELMSYMPYLSELPEIRQMAEEYDEPDHWKYRFICESEECALAYLPDNGYYKNLNRFEFEVPKEDIDALTARVKLAGTMLIGLIDIPSVAVANYDQEVKAVIVE